MNTVKVTVLMPAYNAERYIADAINSILNQSFPYFELLIVNDCSTDRTEEIIRSFTDPRIVIINQENGGVSKALNTGLKYARAQYIARFDADDICYPHRLMIQYNFMEANTAFVLVGGNAEYMDMKGEYVFTLRYLAYSDEEIRNLPAEVCPFSHVTVMYKKEVVQEVGGYDENAHTFEDHLLWSKLTQRGKVCNLPDILVKVRFSPESLTIDEKWRGERFTSLKYNAIRKREITPAEGNEILRIIRSQDVLKIKKASYHSLLAKKYLWDNYKPRKARENIYPLITSYPLKAEGYILLALSFLPSRIVATLRKRLLRKQAL